MVIFVDILHRMLYTQAVILEGLRWGRVLVHGVPKKIAQDFVYRKYYFRKVCAKYINF